MKLEIGKVYKRTELHNFFGGQSQGGISTPKEYKYIFIIEYKKSGKDFGYEDGWESREGISKEMTSDQIAEAQKMPREMVEANPKAMGD